MKHYETLIAQLADLYIEEPSVVAQLRAMTIHAEEWDENRSGGHFYTYVPDDAPKIDNATVDAFGIDIDGVPIDIILHPVNGRIAWGEWVRIDGEPVQQWPPATVVRTLLDSDVT